jgi:hypothetical protein
MRLISLLLLMVGVATADAHLKLDADEERNPATALWGLESRRAAAQLQLQVDDRLARAGDHILS